MNARTIIVGSAVALTVVLLMYFYMNRDEEKYQWYQNYRPDSDQPYGTMFIQKMLKENYEGKVTINQKEAVHKIIDAGGFEDGKTDYVLIGQNIYLDYTDVDALANFISEGNNVFIATMEVPETLIAKVYQSKCDGAITYTYYSNDSIVKTNFYHPKFHKEKDYTYLYRMGSKDYTYTWRTLSEEALCDSVVGFTPLGYQQEVRVNFLRIPYGKGFLYLHSGPLMFTNYFLTKKDNREYASSVFAHMSGKDLIWDEVSKVPFSELQNIYDSPLYYIMQQPALKYAWWMLLAGALLYVAFASKRTQRVIPVLETKTNTSLEFLNVISSLHYQNPNHLDMARKKMKYFLYFIRAKYGINAQVYTEEHAKRLAEKAKVDVADTHAIFERFKAADNYMVGNEEPELLFALYQAIDKFYKTCK